MLLKKYHIVVFKDNEGVCKKLYIRGWVLFALFGLFISLVAGNVHFWSYFADYTYVQSRLAKSEKTVDEQKSQLVSLAGKLKVLEKDLSRIRDFDTKLRVMINMENQVESASSMGGDTRNSFSKSYLPVHRQELLARKMHSFLNQLTTDVRLEEMRQEELLQSFKDNKSLLVSTPSLWPTQGWITSPFGQRISPFTGQKEFHQGLDISGPIGTPIVAPAKGVISFTGVDGGFGKTILIKHGSNISTRYAHLSSFKVKQGQSVKRGEVIGYLGNSGRSTGPHLHYEVRLNGVCVNPMRYLIN